MKNGCCFWCACWISNRTNSRYLYKYFYCWKCTDRFCNKSLAGIHSCYSISRVSKVFFGVSYWSTLANIEASLVTSCVSILRWKGDFIWIHHRCTERHNGFKYGSGYYITKNMIRLRTVFMVIGRESKHFTFHRYSYDLFRTTVFHCPTMRWKIAN